MIGSGARPPFGGERGAVVIWSLGLILMLFFAGGLALDLWRVLSWHGTLTGIADKAALAGANEMNVSALFYNRFELDRSSAKRTAEEFAQNQPEWDDDSMTVTAIVKKDRDRWRVYVKVSGEVQLTLLRLFAPPQGITVPVTSSAYPCVHRTDRGASLIWEDCMW